MHKSNYVIKSWVSKIWFDLQAVDELFKMMRLMATKYSDSSEEEVRSINSFKKNTSQMFLNMLDARSGWQTLIR